jgi:hypothetical protein
MLVVVVQVADCGGKCNGLKPCNTCTKRSLTCSYTPNGNPDQNPPDNTGSPTKKRHVEDVSTSVKSEASGSTAAQLHSPVTKTSPAWEQPPKQLNGSTQHTVDFDIPKPMVSQAHSHKPTTDDDYETRTRQSTISGPDEEAVVYSSTRMLQDPTGRLCKPCRARSCPHTAC